MTEPEVQTFEPAVWPDIAGALDAAAEIEDFEPRDEKFARLLNWLLVGKTAFPNGRGQKSYNQLLAGALGKPSRVGLRVFVLMYAIRPDLLNHASVTDLASSAKLTRWAVMKEVNSFVAEFPAMKPARCFGGKIARTLREARRKSSHVSNPL